MNEGMLSSKVLAALSQVIEPDLKKDIVSLGLVKDLKIEGTLCTFTVFIQNPTMHAKARMQEACEFQLKKELADSLTYEITVEVINPSDRPDLRKVIPGVKNIIAISSGKGGVGKSTMATNIALGLSQLGHHVGFLDADVYGPSAPTMFGLEGSRPQTVNVDGKNLIEPVMAYGIKILSLGFFAEANQAIIWRGPVATKALRQMFMDTNWGELDYLIIDLPPGTGDIHLSIVQTVPVTGAVVVSTPQQVALADARKGVSMFQQENINVPVLGIIENMSYFTPAELPDNKYYIFGKDGAKALAEELDLPLLGEIPLVQSIREAADVGRPAILQEDSPVSKALMHVVYNIIEQTDKRNNALPPTSKVNIKV